MKKAKFIQDAKLSPGRYYRNPSDVVRDRRLTNPDRLEILAAWERDARERQEREESGVSESDPLQQLRRVREELQRQGDLAEERSITEAGAEQPLVSGGKFGPWGAASNDGIGEDKELSGASD